MIVRSNASSATLPPLMLAIETQMPQSTALSRRSCVAWSVCCALCGCKDAGSTVSTVAAAKFVHYCSAARVFLPLPRPVSEQHKWQCALGQLRWCCFPLVWSSKRGSGCVFVNIAHCIETLLLQSGRCWLQSRAGCFSFIHGTSI